MKTNTFFFGCSLVLLPLPAFAQGSLTPPGAPAPTMKTLDQIEARTPISALPFTISSSGSYFVTGNLTAQAGGNGVTINASNVTLDLGGFELVGNGGVGAFGIRVSAGRFNVIIRNGTVRGWNGPGVAVENSAVSPVWVESVRALNGGGIALGIGSVVVDCLANGVPGNGIATGDASLVLRCHSRGNGLDGILVGTRSVVRECVATNNGSDGIQAFDGSEVSGCAASANANHGVNASEGCLVRDCTVEGNSGIGILSLAGSTVQSCAARNNAAVGISVGTGSTVAGCTANANNGVSGISLSIHCSAIGCTADSNTNGAATSQGISGSTACFISRCIVGNTLSTAGTATANTGAGIVVGSESIVENCVVHSNKGDGIRAIAGASIIGNNCVSNGGGGAGDGAGIHVTSIRNRIDGNYVATSDRGIEVDSTGNIIVRNVCIGSSPNYDMVANNIVGPVVQPGNSVAINSNVQIASSLATTDPWANLSD